MNILPPPSPTRTPFVSPGVTVRSFSRTKATAQPAHSEGTHLEAGRQLSVVEETHVLQDERLGGRADVRLPSGHPVLAEGGAPRASATAAATATTAAAAVAADAAVGRLGPARVFEGADG